MFTDMLSYSALSQPDEQLALELLEEAQGWLEKAVNERAPWVPELKLEPTCDSLRSDPRFLALLKRVGFEK
jgi:hypothetical protein